MVGKFLTQQREFISKYKQIKSFIAKTLLKGKGPQPKGQVIVEYILLLVISTALALLLVKLVSVEPGKNTPVFQYWKHLLEVIGNDIST